MRENGKWKSTSGAKRDSTDDERRLELKTSNEIKARDCSDNGRHWLWRIQMAIDLASHFPIEIINADFMQVTFTTQV